MGVVSRPNTFNASLGARHSLAHTAFEGSDGKFHSRADGSLAIWSSRHHRKKLVLPEAVKALAIAETVLHSLWITLLGAIGFLVGSLLMLAETGLKSE